MKDQDDLLTTLIEDLDQPVHFIYVGQYAVIIQITVWP